MKLKRTSWVMLITIIILVIAVHNTLHSAVKSPNEIVIRSMHTNDAMPSYFAGSFLRMAK